MRLRYVSLFIPLLLSVYVWVGTPYVPLHGDEPTQMYMGRDSYYLLVQRDLARVLYNPTSPEPDQQELRLLNGTLPKYLIGIGMIHMGYTLDTWQKPYDWGAPFDHNQRYSHLPPQDVLVALRYVQTALTIAALWGVFALGWMMGGALAASVAALVFGLNPAVLIDGRRLMMEAAMLCFSVWAVVVAVVLAHRLTQAGMARSAGLLAALFGIVCGLAVASKHTALFTVGALWLGLLLLLAYRLLRRTRTHTLRWLAAGTAALALMGGVFYSLNPAWWGAPVERAATVLALRQALLRGQAAAFGGYATLAEQTAGFFRQSFAVYPQYYQVAAAWALPLRPAVQRYEAGGYGGIAPGRAGGALLAALTMLGVGWMLRRGAAGVVMLVWGAAMIALTWLITPLEWQRYYLPLYPWIAVAAGCGIALIVERFAGRQS